jgi:hypothetical protein
MHSNHRLLTLLIAIVGTACLCACEPVERTRTTSDPTADLAGRWEIEFVATKGTGRGAKARGIVTLHNDPVPVSQCLDGADAYLCATQTRGSHTVATGALLGHELSQEAGAGLLSNDEILLVIGTCCDRGEVSAKGRWRNARFEGRWSDTWLSGATAEGRFRMQRLTSQ